MTKNKQMTADIWGSRDTSLEVNNAHRYPDERQ